MVPSPARDGMLYTRVKLCRPMPHKRASLTSPLILVVRVYFASYNGRALTLHREVSHGNRRTGGGEPNYGCGSGVAGTRRCRGVAGTRRCSGTITRFLRHLASGKANSGFPCGYRSVHSRIGSGCRRGFEGLNYSRRSNLGASLQKINLCGQRQLHRVATSSGASYRMRHHCYTSSLGSFASPLSQHGESGHFGIVNG